MGMYDFLLKEISCKLVSLAVRLAKISRHGKVMNDLTEFETVEYDPIPWERRQMIKDKGEISMSFLDLKTCVQENPSFTGLCVLQTSIPNQCLARILTYINQPTNQPTNLAWL